MTKIWTYYNNAYGADTYTLSMRKLPLVADRVCKRQFAKLIAPKRVDEIVPKLKKVHDPAYVDSVISGEGAFARSSGLGWSEEIRDGVLASNAGLLEAVEVALEGRRLITSSLSQGFHHAQYDHGEGFCTFNGLALVASEFPNHKIMVIDADEHQGNGTKEFTKRLPNLYNVSIFGTHFGQDETLPRSWDYEVQGWKAYKEAILRAEKHMFEIKPDVIIYQAGVDCIKGDGMDTVGLTSKQAFERDKAILSFARWGMPIVFVLAGGYGKEAVKNHVNTFRAAQTVAEKFSQPQLRALTK